MLSSCLLAELRACLLLSCAYEIAQVALHLPPSRSLSSSLSWLPPLNLSYSLSFSLHFFFFSFPNLPLPSSALNILKPFCPLILIILLLLLLCLSLSVSLGLCLSVSHAAGTGWVCLPDCPPGIAAGGTESTTL